MINIEEQKTYLKIKEEVDEIVFQDDYKRAFGAYNLVSQAMKASRLGTKDPELSKKYNKFLVKLQWVAINFFNYNEILQIFQNHLQIAFELEGFDLPQKTRLLLVGILDLDERDKYKRSIINILNKNEAVLTHKRFADNSIPTVENWIKKYTSKTGVGQVESVKFEQFFIQDKDVLALDGDERRRLKDFFKFYEKLKASSSTVAGFEGSLPVNTPDFKGYIQNGALEREVKLDRKTRELLDVVMGIKKQDYNVDKEISDLESQEKQFAEGSLEKKMIDEELEKERKIKEMQLIADGYKGGSFERKAILEEIEKLKKL